MSNMILSAALSSAWLATAGHDIGFADESIASSEWLPKTPQLALQALQAKDAQLDNAAITYEKTTIVERSPAAEWFQQQNLILESGGKSSPAPKSFGKPYKVKVVVQNTLVVRGDSITIDATSSTDSRGRPLTSGKPLFIKRSNATGIEESFVSVNERRILRTDSRPPNPHGLLYEDAMLAQFCMGFGYGKRAISVDSIRANGEMAVVEVTMRLWSRDVTKGTLKIDKHFIVREATLLANSRGDETRFEIATEGLIGTPSGRGIGRLGQFKRTALTAMVRGKKQELKTVREDSEVNVLKVQYDLKNEEYERLIKIDRASATDVDDRTPRVPPKNVSSN